MLGGGGELCCCVLNSEQIRTPPHRYKWRAVFDLGWSSSPSITFHGPQPSVQPYPSGGGYIMGSDIGSLPFKHCVPPVAQRTCVLVFSCYEGPNLQQAAAALQPTSPTRQPAPLLPEFAAVRLLASSKSAKALGKSGGKSTSPKKAKAARLNGVHGVHGKKGGRPKVAVQLPAPAGSCLYCGCTEACRWCLGGKVCSSCVGTHGIRRDFLTDISTVTD